MYSEIGKGFKENFYGEYRKGVLRKKYSISLIVYETYLIGTGFRVFDSILPNKKKTGKIIVSANKKGKIYEEYD